MRKSIVLPLLTVVGGAVGFLLRRWERASAFELETGLPIPNAPATWALVGFSLLMAVALFLLCRSKGRDFPGGYGEAFSARGNLLHLTALLLAAALLLAGGVLSFLHLPMDHQTALAATAPSQSPSTLPVLIGLIPKVLMAVFAVASGFSMLLLAHRGYRGGGKKKNHAALLMPGYLTAVWLISTYQSRAGDPVRQGYVYELLAIVAALLAAYLIATFSFEKGRVTRTATFCLLAVYLCAVTLADGHSLAHALLYGAMLLYLVCQAAALLHNDARPAATPEEAPQTEIETEEPHNEG